MAQVIQSKHAPAYEVSARWRLRCEAKIIYFHVFNVTLSHSGGKTSACLVLALAGRRTLWAPTGFYRPQTLRRDVNAQIVQSFMEALAPSFEA